MGAKWNSGTPTQLIMHLERWVLSPEVKFVLSTMIPMKKCGQEPFAQYSARVIIKEKEVNRGAGYCLYVSCEYHFKPGNFSCNWLKEKLVKDQFNVQC